VDSDAGVVCIMRRVVDKEKRSNGRSRKREKGKLVKGENNSRLNRRNKYINLHKQATTRK
jgi:hypothetical protein